MGENEMVAGAAEAWAQTISEIEDDAERERLADMFADAIEDEVGPGFDRAAFISACGVEP